MVEPLYGGKSAVEVVAMIAGTADKGPRHRQELLDRAVAPVSEGRTWNKALHDGVIRGTQRAWTDEGRLPDAKKIAAALGR